MNLKKLRNSISQTFKICEIAAVFYFTLAALQYIIPPLVCNESTFGFVGNSRRIKKANLECKVAPTHSGPLEQPSRVISHHASVNHVVI